MNIFRMFSKLKSLAFGAYILMIIKPLYLCYRCYEYLFSIFPNMNNSQIKIHPRGTQKIIVSHLNSTI